MKNKENRQSTKKPGPGRKKFLIPRQKLLTGTAAFTYFFALCTNQAYDVLFYTEMRSGELLALTPADILPSKRIDINKRYAKVKGEELFLEPKTPKAKRCISIP